MSMLLEFKGNDNLTIGVELELQLVNLHNFNLAMEAEDFLRRASYMTIPGELKPEITQAMIEINSSVHDSYGSLLAELHTLRDILTEQASQSHIGICGGGTHPFQKWKEQRIFQTERFANVSEQYGYLAKQFTVFGQHIHVSCPNGDDALYLCHAMVHYIPQFIALSASSPFNQGIDTAFDCSRLAVISAFPLSGTPPWLLKWKDFQKYFNKMAKLNIVKNMKDFYWDIRPKPEYGTIELRICDTPLTMRKAADLAAYVQMLAAWLLDKRHKLSREIYLTYLMNRFRAARYGYDAIVINPIDGTQQPLSQDILQTCDVVEAYASRLKSLKALNNIRAAARKRYNNASWLRMQYANFDSLNDVVKAQTKLWTE